jgi:hypothetical protein
MKSLVPFRHGPEEFAVLGLAVQRVGVEQLADIVGEVLLELHPGPSHAFQPLFSGLSGVTALIPGAATVPLASWAWTRFRLL